MLRPASRTLSVPVGSEVASWMSSKKNLIYMKICWMSSDVISPVCSGIPENITCFENPLCVLSRCVTVTSICCVTLQTCRVSAQQSVSWSHVSPRGFQQRSRSISYLFVHHIKLSSHSNKGRSSTEPVSCGQKANGTSSTLTPHIWPIWNSILWK